MTPLYDAIRAYAQEKPLRMHMPGHKGKSAMPLGELAAIAPLDVTELGPTGDLFSPGAPFDQAQELWARDFGMEGCQFLTGGSTQGLHTALALSCRPGDAVLVDRGCHRAVFNAMALLDLRPIYLPRPWWTEEGLTGPISPEMVESVLSQHPEVKTVCITSPSYSGVLCDVAAISHIVHRYGGKLVVDGAHGAHLPFLGVDAFAGADLLICSAHKTLPALGQTALLFYQGEEPERVRRFASVYGSSSPSYPMMLSLDAARDWMEGPGQAEYRRAAEGVARLRRRFPSLNESIAPLDPTRLTLMARDGHAMARRLEELGVFVEMADSRHVVCILTAMDEEADFVRLEAALDQCRDLMGPGPKLPPPPLPRAVLTPREALFAPERTLPLEQCLGRVAAGQLAPYPPGVPVVAPGEMISEKELAYLKEIGYNNDLVPVVEH